jgi:3-dehydroquinate dehydratase
MIFADDEDFDLYNDYMNYLREDLEIDDIEWSHKVKWCVLINDKPKEVVSYHNWKKMLKRQEKIDRLLNE